MSVHIRLVFVGDLFPVWGLHAISPKCFSSIFLLLMLLFYSFSIFYIFALFLFFYLYAQGELFLTL